MSESLKSAFVRVLLGMLICLLGLISFKCMDNPLTPVAPQSDIKLNGISIIDITKYISELAEKTEGTVINNDGTLSYIATQHANPIGIDSIKLDLSPSSQQVDVGVFAVEPFAFNQNILASDISGSLSGTTVVPEMSLQTNPIVIDNSLLYDYAAISSGSMTLSITNNMPVAIDFPKSIHIRNNSVTPLDTSLMASFSISGELAANGGTAVIPVANLSGKFLRGLLKTDSIEVHTVGSATPVTFNSTSGISISLVTSNLIVDSARAIVPSQTVPTSFSDTTLVLDDSVVVQSAAFKSGSFQIKINNNLDISVGVSVTINEFIYNSASFSINRIITGKDSLIENINAVNLSFSATPKTLGTDISVKVKIETINSNNLKKTVTKTDFVKASIIPVAPLLLKSITGKIKTQNIQINSGIASGINFNDMNNLTADSIKFSGVKLNIKLPMTGGYPMDYNLLLTAKSKGSIVDTISIGTHLAGFNRIYPGNPVIQISNAPGFDNFLSRFFPVAPDSFYVTGTVVLNPEFANPATLLYSTYDTSKVYPTVDIDFPLNIGIKNGKILSVTGFGKDDIPKDLTDAIKTFDLSFNVINKIPMQMNFIAQFVGNYNTQAKTCDTLLTIVPSNVITAASIDAQGFATTPSTSKIAVSLNSYQMQQFNNADSLALIFNLLTANNGQIVKVRDTDYIRVYLKGDITYTINKKK